MRDDAMMSDEELELHVEDTFWAPAEEVTRHAGTPYGADPDFFVDPPAEIGEVLTAETTLKATARPWKTASRIVLAGLVGWAGAMILHLAYPQEDWILETLLFPVLAGIVWFLTRFRHTCSYVGKLGAARFRCRGRRDRLKPSEIFLFADATELRTSQTRQYYNGVYTGTSYSYLWTDAEGKKRYKLSGTYRGEKKPPKPAAPFHFALSTEGAWSLYLIEPALRDLETHGSIRFNLKSGQWIALGPGFLDVNLAGQPEHRLTAEEIGEVAMDQGVLKIKRVDAKEGWFSSKGVYKFGSDAMANFRLFGTLYPRLMSPE